MDADNSKHPHGAIAIRGREIVAVGPEAEVVSKYRPLRTLDAKGGRYIPAT